MSLKPGDYSLDIPIGKSLDETEYLVISNRTGTIWLFNERSEVVSFFTGRGIQFYSLYHNSDNKVLLEIEKEIYGENGRFDRLKNE